MPELPELQALAEGLDGALRGRRIEGVRIHHPATIRSADPPLEALAGPRGRGASGGAARSSASRPRAT